MRTDARRLAVLEAMGVDVYRLRRAVRPTPGPAEEAEAGAAPLPAPADDTSRLDWPALEAAVARCTRCPLHATRTQTVFGVGRRDADWMVIGEAPGAEEDRRGEPFVGRAGQLLDQMLCAVGLGRDTVFIANVLKCRPPGNRDPSAVEAQACRGFLDRQIALVAPRLILAVGRVAAQHLLGTDAPLGRLRGRVHLLADTEIPVIVTYHPAYLLRTPGQKRQAWADLCLARRVARGEA
ncbi:MAG TPA: uracil-DNA glycosylase [Woeseiaceae bacterium]|jgi:DNA polymerase|nr:uracil-DNA glycosylase [Woeseiaceae bacterium]